MLNQSRRLGLKVSLKLLLLADNYCQKSYEVNYKIPAKKRTGFLSNLWPRRLWL